MSDREFVNKSLQGALQLIRDEATKPLHVELDRLNAQALELCAEISGLRRENERLRGELLLISQLQAGDGSTINGLTKDQLGRAFRQAQDIARAALADAAP